MTNEQRAEFLRWADPYGMDGTDRVAAWLAWQEQDQRHADALETVALIEELHAAKIDIEFAGDLMDRMVAGATVSVGARRSGVGGGFRYFHGPSWLDCLRQVAKAKREATSDG